MKTEELERLEYSAQELIELCRELRQENQRLRNRESNLITKFERLHDKNELAIAKIKTMVLRLKNLEGA